MIRISVGMRSILRSVIMVEIVIDVNLVTHLDLTMLIDRRPMMAAA